MPTTPTYPGVYIEEIPSGLRTITGVSTSVTAFVGSARRGPINRAVRLLGFADFERRFGGLQKDSELGYAVRQFFQNGGAEAWAVRIARNAQAATRILETPTGTDVLTLTARDEGKSGNFIEIRVDYETENPASTFDLTFSFVDPENPSESVVESFPNLTMNSKDARYVEDVLREQSELVSGERIDAALGTIGSTWGRSVSAPLEDEGGNLLDVQTLLDATHNQLQVSVNASTPVPVVINLPGDISAGTPTTRLTALCNAIQTKVEAALGAGTFTCQRDGSRIAMESRIGPNEESTVRVLPGERNDASARLRLGTASGGVETDAVAAIRPAEMPSRGSLRSGSFSGTDLDGLPSTTANSLKISIDGYGPDPIVLTMAAISAGGGINDKIDAVAAHLQEKVRAAKPANPAYAGFRATRDGSRLLLESGTRGAGSSVQIYEADANSIADELKLLAGSTATQGRNETLEQGDEAPYTDADVYNLVIADRSQRRGLYALESVDLFNILCLPGITDAGVISDAAAYCRERRAFLIVDPPRATDRPDEMETLVRGTSLPKTNNAAVYYPWIQVTDPLRGGRPRPAPPSGSIAGLYARTDAARGIWKAPAGIEATLVGVQGVDYLLTDGENGILNPRGVNAIRIIPGIGAVAWGARTLRGDDGLADEYKYVPVRRLALYIEESLYRGSKWVVFEPNDEALWAQIRLNLGAFMHDLFRQGAFQGTTPAQAYLVKCDAETTTQNDIDRGVVNILVGFAPLKPAEFVFIRIQQKVLQGEA